MTQTQDILDIASLGQIAPPRRPAAEQKRTFLSIWFRCCHVYGRLYRNAARTSYNGCCPRCRNRARVLVRSDGTTRRCFQAI
ncbi:MAG: hypothetical protein MK116_12160 [Phycisphaerales bacterium]|nr:hypothetical protein [Phycisphaerales bacterium]